MNAITEPQGNIYYYPLFPNLVDLNDQRGADVLEWVEKFLYPSGLAVKEEDKANAYLIVSGDGGFMRAALSKHLQKKMLFGINRGTLGFLLNPISDINQIPVSFSQVRRIAVKLIQGTFYNKNGEIKSFLAFNDIFCGGDIADYIEFKISGSLSYFPNRKVLGNGIIVSTPQGTTAYGLKARGTAAVLPLDTQNWFVSGMATGPYPCDQVNPQEITISVKSKNPVNGYADGYIQMVKDITKIVITPTNYSVILGFLSDIDFEARRTQLVQQEERGE